MARRFYWHVPEWSDSTEPQNLGSNPILNDAAGNLTAELINSDFADPDDPRQDNFVCERVVGQYLMVAASGADGGPRIIHHRVYVVDGDQNVHAVRDLYSQDDANTSFLWHKVEGWDSTWIGQPWGTWATGATNTPAPTFERGRKGHFDIRVGRRVTEGQSLIWHTKIDTGGLVTDDFHLHLWCRVLMREAS